MLALRAHHSDFKLVPTNSLCKDKLRPIGPLSDSEPRPNRWTTHKNSTQKSWYEAKRQHVDDALKVYDDDDLPQQQTHPFRRPTAVPKIDISNVHETDDIEADVYVLVDGDDTYDATGAPAMVERLEDNYLDMIVGERVAASDSAYRAGHRFGNLLLTRLVAFLFGNRISDMLSGYRVFSRRFVKSFPALSAGFETETELTIHALELRMPIEEMSFPYKMRPVDSSSKLNTYRDGWRILKTIIKLAKEEKPFLVFGSLSVVFAFVSLLLAWPLLATYLETGLVPRLPTAILATGLMLLAFLTLACGAILDVVTLGRREVKRLSYLELPRYRRPRYRRFTDSQERPEIAVR